MLVGLLVVFVGVYIGFSGLLLATVLADGISSKKYMIASGVLFVVSLIGVKILFSTCCA